MKLMSDSISQIAPALVTAQMAMSAAKKDSTNPYFKSKYADLNSVREASIPALNAAGIVALQPTVVVDGKKFVQTMLLHSSGEFISALTEILSVKDTSAQDQGSGISYARRYGLQSLVNIGSEDDDGQRATFGETKTSVKEQAKIVEEKTPVSAPAVSGNKSFRKPQPVSNGGDV
jgi:hypothetical protein